MKHGDIAAIRLKAQHLANSALTTVEEVVERMGAIQAQDYAMSKWAVGVRLPGSTDDSVEEALRKGTILRTHVLRPTWHLVSAKDIRWMLELTGPGIRSAMRSRNRQLGITEELSNKSNDILVRLLEGNKHLTREELVKELAAQRLVWTGEQAAHVLFGAELDGIVCSGVMNGKKQTYALLEERCPEKTVLSHDEALAKLAKTYFTNHAPATLADFTWWSGLSVGNARRALEMISKEFESRTIGELTYWFPPALADLRPKQPSVLLLPAFDEFLISYKDRTATISTEHQPKAFTTNGIFRPTVVIDGQTTGIWKRTIKKDSVVIETTVFHQHNKKVNSHLEQAAKDYATFLGKKLIFNIE